MKTKVMPFMIFIGVFLILLSGCYISINSHKDGNGNVTSQERAIRNFDCVILNGIGDVNIHFDDYYRVEVITDSNIQDMIITKVNGNNLYIETANNFGFEPTKLIINVYLPELKNVKLKGVGNIVIANGKASHFEMELSGVGNIDAKNYNVENVNVSLSGVGDIKTWVTRKLTGKISGVGDVYYKGNPTIIDVDTNITGKVKKM